MLINNVGEGILLWAMFRFPIFSNYFLQKFEKMKITVWKSDNYVWKFLFRFVLILLHIKSASKNIWRLDKAGSSTSAFGHTFASL